MVVEGRIVEELLVEHCIKEDVKVAHEPSVIAVLVLCENGQQSVIAFVLE